MSLDGAVVNIESLRWGLHYLDASTADQGKARAGKGNVYVTGGNPNKDWAKWKIIDRGDGVYNLESIRWKGHFLDASTADFADSKRGKGNVYVTDGNPDHCWAKWKITPRDGKGVVYIESIQWPGHYLEASTGKVGKGHVYVTKTGHPEKEEWAKWKFNIVHQPRPDGISSIAARLIPIVIHTGGVGEGSFRKKETYKVGFQSETYSSSTITDISVEASGRIDVAKWSADADMNTSIKQGFQSASAATSEEREVTQEFTLHFKNPFYVYQAQLYITTLHGKAEMKGSALVFSGSPLVQTVFTA